MEQPLRNSPNLNWGNGNLTGMTATNGVCRVDGDLAVKTISSARQSGRFETGSAALNQARWTTNKLIVTIVTRRLTTAPPATVRNG